MMTEQQLLEASQMNEGQQKYLHPVVIMQLREQGWYKPDQPHLSIGPYLGATADPADYQRWQEAGRQVLQYRAIQRVRQESQTTNLLEELLPCLAKGRPCSQHQSLLWEAMGRPCSLHRAPP